MLWEVSEFLWGFSCLSLPADKGPPDLIAIVIWAGQHILHTDHEWHNVLHQMC